MKKGRAQKISALFLLICFALLDYFYIYPIKIIDADNSVFSVTVGNATPTTSSVTINGGSAITLTEATSTAVAITGTVTDLNGCEDLVTVNIAIYKQGTTCVAAGNADNDNCYFYQDTNPAGSDSCTGEGDTTYVASYSFNVQYYADGGTWLATITPADSEGGTGDNSSGVTLNDLQSLDVSSSLNFGAVTNGSNSTGDNTTTVTNTGNIEIDFEVSGEDLTCSTTGAIPVGNEEYSLSSFTYGDGTDLTDTGVDVNASLASPGNDTIPITDIVYWQINIPNGVEGTCSGNTTFTAQAAL